MDMEETETIPALLVSSAARRETKSGGGGGGAAGITVTLSSRDPLRVEVEGGEGGGGGGGGGQKVKKPVPSLDEEISGVDVYEIPLAPSPVVRDMGSIKSDAVDGNEGKEQKDVFKAQREEGKRWIRISRGWDVEPQDGEVEVFKLTEIISR